MSEPRKLAVIGHCGQCPHYHGKISGQCHAAKRLVEWAYGVIPNWCPLPDAPPEGGDRG